MNEKKTHKGKTGLVIAVAAILVFSGITAYNYWKLKTKEKEVSEREEAIPVETAPVEMRRFDWTLEQTGNIRPLLEVSVNPKVGGEIIREIHVEKGDPVKKGALLATLEDNTIKARIKQAEAALRSARASLDKVKANLEFIKKNRIRLKKLVKLKAISEQDVDEIDSMHEAALAGKELAKAQIESAKASLNLLKIIHKDHQILSPISGHISARYLDPGSISSAKKPIVRVSDEHTVKIITTVSEQDYPHIKKGMKAELRVASFPGETFTGTVSVINPTLDPSTRTGEIEIRVPNQDLTLHSGMFVHIRLHLGQIKALVIPKDALMRRPGTGSYYVFTIEKERAMLKNIAIGLIQENYAEIKEGLKKGEQVVIKGQNRLRDGAVVKVLGAGPEGKGGEIDEAS